MQTRWFKNFAQLLVAAVLVSVSSYAAAGESRELPADPLESVMWENKECPLSQAFKEDLYTIDSILPLAKDIRLPWLIAHGADDDVVFPNHGEQLYASLKGKKKHVVYDGEEHHFEGVLPKLLDEIDKWLHFTL